MAQTQHKEEQFTVDSRIALLQGLLQDALDEKIAFARELQSVRAENLALHHCNTRLLEQRDRLLVLGERGGK